VEERLGGASIRVLGSFSDCMTWTLRRPGFNGTSQQLRGSIANFYTSHPSGRSKPISDVWSQLWAKQTPHKKSEKADAGENWGDPHWYLDGYWWGQSASDGKLGFIEGHLSCLGTYTDNAKLEYPRSASFYLHKVDDYYDSHPKQSKKAIADVLTSFRRALPKSEDQRLQQ
jgi:hypothetical protein